MWFMYLMSWLALVIQIIFVTLSIAAGLYYTAELIEEYTVAAGKCIRYIIFVTSGVYVGLLLFESLPMSLILVGLATNAVYLMVLRTFPFIEITSFAFIASLVLIVVNHYFAFSYFASVWHPFSEVLAFFTVCLWLVPFCFFVSLSANENVLPTMAERPKMSSDENDGDIVSNYFRKQSKRNGLLSFFKYAQESMLPQRVKKAF